VHAVIHSRLHGRSGHLVRSGATWSRTRGRKLAFFDYRNHPSPHYISGFLKDASLIQTGRLRACSTDGPECQSGPIWHCSGRAIAGRPVSVAIHPGRLPIQHLRREVLRRPVESTQYLSIRYTERLAEAGIELSVGSTGDSYDNALAETVIGLFKTEEIYRRGPWKGLEDVEFATLEWVAWYNRHRLFAPLGYVPPAEFEQAYHDRQAAPASLAVLT
jgi:putative transposase